MIYSLSKEETEKRIRKFFNENGIDGDSCTDKDIGNYLLSMFFQIQNGVIKEQHNISEKVITMVTEARLEKMLDCYYEDLYEYYMKYIDNSEFEKYT